MYNSGFQTMGFVCLSHLSPLSTLSTLKHMPLLVSQNKKRIFHLSVFGKKTGNERAIPHNPAYSNQLSHSPMFDVLHGIRQPLIFMAKKD